MGGLIAEQVRDLVLVLESARSVLKMAESLEEGVVFLLVQTAQFEELLDEVFPDVF